ncbi:NADH-quinone oxidoreductase subunit NuoK [Syntrophobacter fumaroxidans]|uniref:NADH-quinone oxidoreductase subunit K 2 n=1 Tax=Syntrophobacter fumaroxidans (strain DSM 10017 / MPOB) TaxID=335543 RepID=NUOK2_SYNFM|nr:NADH-quinone oxidoreductase subunit NuoK [Syntrophobacter fumaroxidans]A0LJM1.1 RecName: Full=NADH-quinone oxidoreductase subunit K 2; AltName: Full=NADH dehydrogenase I subunit K 2; AltName: Full=NDH-1 subunit K 2 [Syntrophobacter fumaroxidans MPOB]ABK17623.1 NADH-ubiquinone oxidoreductase, chain 4L [Syntrophobacter fumaroxidans MPOB]
MIVPFGHVLLLAGALFGLGVFCAVARRNLIMIVLGVEIMLNAASIAFIGAAARWQSMEGQAFVLFILAVAATEVSIGLAIIVYAFRRTGSFDPAAYNLMKAGDAMQSFERRGPQ